MIAPIYLTSNQPAERFYRGGNKIRSFRGLAADGDRVPEDWVGSATTLFGSTSKGLSELPGGGLLIDAISADPEAWLGPEHLSKFGADSMLLVKLLDAGERLPVHVHPNRRFAAEHLGRRHGKAEAWYILDGGTVHLGFRRDVESEELGSWVSGQDSQAMLEAMHEVSVTAGDGVYIPPGLPTRSALAYFSWSSKSRKTFQSCSSGKASTSTAPRTAASVWDSQSPCRLQNAASTRNLNFKALSQGRMGRAPHFQSVARNTSGASGLRFRPGWLSTMDSASLLLSRGRAHSRLGTPLRPL